MSWNPTLRHSSDGRTTPPLPQGSSEDSRAFGSAQRLAAQGFGTPVMGTPGGGTPGQGTPAELLFDDDILARRDDVHKNTPVTNSHGRDP